MFTKHLGYKIAILSLLVLASAIGASAQRNRDRNWDGYPNLGGSFDLRQTALNAGYNEGSKEGRNDRSHNRYRNYSDFSAYRNADKDYNSRYGDRELYHRYFRLAFESGYETENPGANRGDRNDRDRGDRNDRDRDDRDRNRNQNQNQNQNQNDDTHRGRNWDRYGQFGGSFQLRQTALNAGYNAAIKQGRDDRKHNRHRNYNDFSDYRNATTDYSSKLGDKELYRRYYREGFENGYEDGYRGY
jgi:hypothetical protein